MTLVDNKRARFDYTLQKEYEAGVELLGFEVKALKNKRGSLSGARVVIRGGEAFIVGATIEPYQVDNTPDTYDPTRARRLLLKKKEIQELATADLEKGLTLVPLAWYNNRNKVKLSFAVARGKKKHDKRETIKERETARSLKRVQKGR